MYFRLQKPRIFVINFIPKREKDILINAKYGTVLYQANAWPLFVNVRIISLSDEKTFILPQGNLEMDSKILFYKQDLKIHRDE